MENMNVDSKTDDSGAVKDEKLLFDDKIVRRGFIRKVFLIVLSQLILSCLIIAPLLLYEPIKRAIIQDKGIFLSSVVIFWALSTSIVCCVGISRPWPQNFIILTFMTVSMSVAVGCICAIYDFHDILTAISSCAIICIFLAICASQTKFDLTMFNGILSIFLIALIMLVILYALLPSKSIIWVIMVSGILLLSLYFMIDIQLMVKGRHRYTLTPDDYIIASALLYIDIMYIFVFLILIIGKK